MHEYSSIFFFFTLSFFQGDVFVVDDVIDMDWLWVTAQKNRETGLVPAALVEDAVSCQPYQCCKVNGLNPGVSVVRVV